KADSPTQKSSSINSTAGIIKHNKKANGISAGHDSDLESPTPASSPRRPLATNICPKQGTALRQLELQHELECMQMQLQFEQERREWAQREAMLLHDRLVRYEGTMGGNAPKQSSQSDDDQGTTRQRQ